MRALIAAALLSGCGIEMVDYCGATVLPGEMRCDGDTAQFCTEDQHWEDWRNCASVGMRCSSSPAECAGQEYLVCCVE